MSSKDTIKGPSSSSSHVSSSAASTGIGGPQFDIKGCSIDDLREHIHVLKSLKTVSTGLPQMVQQNFCDFTPHLADQPVFANDRTLRDMGDIVSSLYFDALGESTQAAETELKKRLSVPELSQPGADASGSSQAK